MYFGCLYCLLPTDLTPCPSVSIVDYEQVNVQWLEDSKNLVGNDVYG